jgi:hypothetical protein
MKTPAKYAVGIGTGLILLAIAFLAVVYPFDNRRQRTPESQAVQSAVRAALRYSMTGRNELPLKLNEEEIRKEVPSYYKGDINIQSLIYLPPANRTIESMKPETILVIAPLKEGAILGFASGNVMFVRLQENIIQDKN